MIWPSALLNSLLVVHFLLVVLFLLLFFHLSPHSVPLVKRCGVVEGVMVGPIAGEEPSWRSEQEIPNPLLVEDQRPQQGQS